MTEQDTRKPLSLKRDASAPRLEERLHKVLAQAGLGSRRALEQRIASGVVKVNGEPATVGMSVAGGDRIELDGKTFVASALSEPARVLLYNKPEGEVTTRDDPEGRPTIFDNLPALKGARWIAIGRLDINTTGLLLLTTDGELANAMMHPSHEVEREYVCRVRPPEGEDDVSDKLVDRLRRGVALDDGPAKFDAVDRIGGTDSHDWFRVLLKEGRNREVRRLWESQGCQVSRLKRIRYGAVSLPQPLLRGHSEELPQPQVDTLRKALGLEDGTPSALTLMPVIGQRRAAKAVHVNERRSQGGYINGNNQVDEGRELRRFDNVREDRRGRGAPRKQGALTVTGDAAANQARRGLKFKGQERQPGNRMKPGERRGGDNPAAMKTWFVPEGVDTGGKPAQRNGEQRPRKPWSPKPAGAAGAGARSYPPRARANRQGGEEGGFNPYGQGAARPRLPYGHPGNAPSFPSDHATPGANPYGERPRGPRPVGARPNGPRPAGARPGPRGLRPAGGAPRGASPRGGNGPRGPRN